MTDQKRERGVRETGASQLSPPVSASMKVRRVGNSLGVILPRDLLAALGVEEGDTVDVVQSEDGRIELTAVDREADELMAMAEEVMAENRAVLRALAK